MNFKRYRDLVIVLLALAVPFWFLRVSMRDPKPVSGPDRTSAASDPKLVSGPDRGANTHDPKVSGPDRVIVAIATPVQYAAATLARGLSNLWGDYIYLVDVKEDNRSLASQNARLAERVRKLEALEEENRRLKRLLDLRSSLKVDVVSAQVIGKNTNEFFRVARVTLDRASHDIGLNLPVLSSDGVVGTTLKISGDTVDVRLVVDAGSGVDVIVQRTGARGFVRGTGDESRYSCSVEYVQRTDEVEVGDLLVTSGVGRRFPKGIPVGTVTQVVRRDFGIYQQVLAAPAVDFSRLEEVLIVTAAPTDEPIDREGREGRPAPAQSAAAKAAPNR